MQRLPVKNMGIAEVVERQSGISGRSRRTLEEIFRLREGRNMAVWNT